MNVLTDEYNFLRLLIEEAGSVVNPDKCTAPTEVLTVVNCHLAEVATMVTDERSDKFYGVERSE